MSGISFLIVLYLLDTFPYPAWSGIRVSAVLVGPSDSTLIFIRPFWHAIFLTNFILSIINIHLSMPQRFYEFYASSCKVNQMSYRKTKFSELILIYSKDEPLRTSVLVSVHIIFSGYKFRHCSLINRSLTCLNIKSGVWVD